MANGWTPERRRAQSLARRGPGNPAWKGDQAGYLAIHKWMNENFPRTGICEECDEEKKTDYAFMRHPERCTRDRSDYRELCRKCHQGTDGIVPYGNELLKAV